MIFVLLAGCSSDNVVPLTEEPVETFDVQPESPKPTQTASEDPDEDGMTLEEKFAKIEFYPVSGVYSRNVMQDDAKMMEMFSLDKHNFIRLASGEFEREIYAYNYSSDDFTYLYYFDNELMVRTVFNMETGAIIEDDDEYAPLLKTDAEELKQYFLDLIQEAGIDINELK